MTEAERLERKARLVAALQKAEEEAGPGLRRELAAKRDLYAAELEAAGVDPVQAAEFGARSVYLNPNSTKLKSMDDEAAARCAEELEAMARALRAKPVDPEKAARVRALVGTGPNAEVNAGIVRMLD